MSISRMLLLRICAPALLLVARPVSAQQATTSAKAVAQMIDVVLEGALPPTFQLGSHTVQERGIRLDQQRAMAAFGVRDDTTSLSSLGLRRAVSLGSRELLKGCNQAGMGDCRNLGTSAYVQVEPVSMSDTSAVVWLHIAWATPGTRRAFLSGLSTQVHLSRSGKGPWKFVRTGVTQTS